MRMPSLNVQIFLGATVGVLMGLFVHQVGMQSTTASISLYTAGIVGTLFIDLLKMVLIPLVFFSIIVGIANLR
ncbi:MAG TPA: cation:dicarboxylase symporter family transporter, partial [Methylophilaceae bacterium]|nr:cation:dicarboxylase symporter family transporter [Methylophilaceae bacterium]